MKLKRHKHIKTHIQVTVTTLHITRLNERITDHECEQAESLKLEDTPDHRHHL